MKTRFAPWSLVVASGLAAFLIVSALFAAERRSARVTEVIRDVHLLAAKAAARPAAVNDTVNEGNAVRTGADSRAELTFADQTITRLGANTVFSVGGGARTYDLGSGAILVTAPKSAGTVRVSSGVATSAVSGFTGVWETHTKFANKILVFEGDLEAWLNKNPTDHRQMHSHQILVFPPNATVLPQPQDFDVCKAINSGLLFTGFSHQLPSWPLLVAECERQRSGPPTQLVDPTGHDSIDQSLNARPIETPPPPARPSPDGELMKRPH